MFSDLIKNPNACRLCDPFSGVHSAFQENDLFDTRTSGSNLNLSNVATFVGFSNDGISHQRVIGSHFLHECQQLITNIIRY